ncbi:hypothetical protein [Arsenicibacter rosenii]|uniref:Uncharacterized protein n=1 Tax=Arsenicibacter rosenii TaxID=1750698 RepID=A0A1S2VQS2_9BACT|nr:hypothetical protein [Arsenicibacter rosenii]OIN61137.1 hypothetical protein BLX24_03490 [Arsenicibacter rosenii]
MSRIEKPFKVIEAEAKAPAFIQKSLQQDIQDIRNVLSVLHTFSAGFPEVMNQLLTPGSKPGTSKTQ